jgi:hypothetical protein
METYGQGQNLQFSFQELGFNAQNEPYVRNLPVGGYTINGLQGFSLDQLNVLRSNLVSALIDGENSRPYFDINLTNLGFTTDPKKLELLDKIINDLKSSINNIDIRIGVLTTKPATISVTGIDFGNVEINKSSTRDLIIKNEGDEELIITNFVGFGSAQTYQVLSPFNWPQISSEIPLKIPKGSSKTLQVIFSPSGIYPISVNIRFESNSTPNAANTARITGNGISPIDTGVESILGKKTTNSVRILTLKNIREINTESLDNPDIISPYYDQLKTKYRSKIIADIWQCYVPFGETEKVQKLLLKDVAIGDGIGSFWFEKCNEFLGGLRPVYQYFYDLEQLKDIDSWAAVIKEDYTNNLNVLTVSNTNVTEIGRYNDFLEKIRQELANNSSKWGKFNKNAPNLTSCESDDISTENYVKNVVSIQFKLRPNQNIFGGFSENMQKRSSNLSDNTLVDLNSEILGNPIKNIENSFVSKSTYGRLQCLQPRTGCYVVDQKPQQDLRIIGTSSITKLLNKSNLPEQIPNYPCYRGFKTRYITGYKWERRWAVQFNCISGPYTDYVWIEDEQEFTNKGTIFEVWENVEFAGTEIGFRETCIPVDIPKEQEPYVDMSDFNGCYELHTTKIFKKYQDYLSVGQKDYIKGPMVLSTENYSGLGPGIKLNKKVTRADCIDTPVKVYHPLHLGLDVIPGKDNIITKGLFTGNQSPFSYHTSSLQNKNSKKYYYEIIDNENESIKKPISYFSISYGNKNGSGSIYSGYEVDDSPTQAIYSQYRLLALEKDEEEFTTYTNALTSSGQKDIYVINFNRDSLTDRIDPGNFEINLSDPTGITNKVMSFIDNSNDLLESKFNNDYSYTYFDIVSGSLENGIENKGTGSAETNTEFTTYGKVFPSLGVIIFDAEKLDNELSFNTNRSTNINGNNINKMFTSISGAASLGMPIKIRSAKNLKTNHYFVRITAGMGNYTNNPTMLENNTTSNNVIKYNYFKNNPTTYITTIGLYNDSKELLAVAKLSKAIMKTPSKDILVKIRLNW